MNKKKKNIVLLGTIIGGLAGAFVNIIKQVKSKEEDSSKAFNYKELIIYSVIGATIGGLSMNLVKFIITVFKDEKEIIDDADEIAYLDSVIGSYEPDEIDALVYRKGMDLKRVIHNKYEQYLLGRPTNQGSVEQGTALSGISDLDILVKFKKTSFWNEKIMFNNLLNFLRFYYQDNDLVNIKNQGESIGMTYKIKGKERTIDVVPALRTDFVRGKNDYKLNSSEVYAKDKPLIMNPHKQKDFGEREIEKKEVLKLIKILSKRNNLPLESFLIKEFINKAFENRKIPEGVNKQLFFVLEYMRDNIVNEKIKSPDNNDVVLTDCLSHKEKLEIAKKLGEIISDIIEEKDSLINYIPINTSKI